MKNATVGYAGLQFSFAEMQREIENLRLLAEPFLEVASFERVLPAWIDQLAHAKNQHGNVRRRWEISATDPIKTILSDGRYEPKGRAGNLRVYGAVSGVWEIEVQRPGKKKPPQTFLLNGMATTQIRLWKQSDEGEEEVARWTVEVGCGDSPGCHFHTQITLDDADRKFPKGLSVPRLPTFIHTPMDALDFVLGEIFQEEWFQECSKGRDPVKLWTRCQRNRFTQLFRWHLETSETASFSPWLTLKRSKPTGLFV